jgi:hypothetical protein
MSEPLFDLLDRLVPRCDEEFGNWQTVLAAASVSPVVEGSASGMRPRRWRPTRRQLITAAIAVAAVTVLFATPAFGLRALILDFVGGRTSVSFVKSRPAPPAIKKRFLDIFAIGAPPGMSLHVLPDQTREITFYGAAGGKRVLWVAPISGGGFCFLGGGGGGGCVRKTTEQQSHGTVSVDGSLSAKPGQPQRFLEINGRVFSASVATLTLEFQDRMSMPLPFVYVSSPIDAGFFYSGLPPSHQYEGHWPTEVIARDSRGTIIATSGFQVATRPRTSIRPFTPQPPRRLPTASSVVPTAPTQTATASGVTITAGANGAVRLTAHGVPLTVARLLRPRVSISCFLLTREFGIFTVRGSGIGGAAFADSIGFILRGIGRPLDGCDISTGGGHRWPDALGSHSPVEIAFTAKGRSYFADRAAARDLALFVRSARMQEIRKEPGPRLLHNMKAAYGAPLAQSRIRYTLTPNGITFTETSFTHKRFQVIVRNGRIARSNVEPYAKVF